MRYKPDSPQETLESTKNRINTMAIVHKKLYQSEDYAHINLKDYIEEQARFLLANNDNLDIDLDLNLDNIKVSMDNAIPLSLIISEILNNSLNYAFPNNQSGIINISYFVLSVTEIYKTGPETGKVGVESMKLLFMFTYLYTVYHDNNYHHKVIIY